MFLDHFIFLFARPKDEPMTFYPPANTKLEVVTVEMTADLQSKLAKQKDAASSRQVELPVPVIDERKYVRREVVDRMVAERVAEEKKQWTTRSDLKERHAEKFHVELLRRESLDLMDKQKRILSSELKVDNEAVKAEEDLVKCYRNNLGKPLECVEQVRKLQSLAKKASLQ